MLKPVFIHEIKKEIQPKFTKLPDEVTYTRGDKLGPKHHWEMSGGLGGSVHILINKTDSHEILLATQVRVPILVKYPDTNGICYEAVAGLIDKYDEIADLASRVRLIASEEVHEEAGYKVAPEDLVALPAYLSNVGMGGSTAYPYYCEVTDADFIGQQLEDSEDIEILAIPYEELRYFLQTCTTTDATTRALILWFILEHQSEW